MTFVGAPEDVFECDRCEMTVLCSRPTLVAKHKWREIRGMKDGQVWKLLLCEDCQPVGDGT